MGWLTPLETGGFQAPGVDSFDFPPPFPGVPWLDKYMIQAIVSVFLVAGFWLIMARKNKMVPTKGQFVGEFATEGMTGTWTASQAK